jgi:hypothetical protein
LHHRFQRNTMKAADCVDRTEQHMQDVGWLCGTHCWACLGLDCHEFRMPLQLHALCASPGKNCQSCRTRDKWWEGDDCVDRTERVQLQRPPSICMLMLARARTKTRGNPDRGTRVPATKSCGLPRWQCVWNAVGAAAQVGMRATARCKYKIASDISCDSARVQQQHDTS